MLQNGTDRVTPSQTMWPLFCNEICLSYDQEEKVRNYQRTLLQTPESWLSRHTAFASTTTMNTAHKATQALAMAISNRERRSASILTAQQCAKLTAYVKEKMHPGSNTTLQKLLTPKSMIGNNDHSYPGGATAAHQECESTNGKTYQLSTNQHVSVNLYVLNDRLSKILQSVPSTVPLVSGAVLKKLYRRPSFESLGARSGEKNLDSDSASASSGGGGGGPLLSRDSANASSGSLKRSASEMSVDDSDERQCHRPSIDPVAAQHAASDIIRRTLGPIQDIIPRSPSCVFQPTLEATSAAGAYDDDDDVDPDTMRLNGEPLPDPVPVAVLSSTPGPGHFIMPLSGHYQPLAGEGEDFIDPKQKRSVSFGCLGVVPEEIWSSEAADDFLMSFADEDWAIGGGIRTDM